MAEHFTVPYRLLVLRMGELWLKGRNRNVFKRRLQKNLSAALRAEIPGTNLDAAIADILGDPLLSEDLLADRALPHRQTDLL